MAEIIIEGVEIKAFAAAIPENPIVSGEGKAATDKLSVDFLSELISQTTRVAHSKQTASDLGYESAKKAIEKAGITASDIGILVFGSSTPDYRSPATAAVLQHRLGIDINCIVFDITGSGSVFANLLSAAASSLKTSNSEYALIVFGDTPSKRGFKSLNTPIQVGDAACSMVLGKNVSADKIHICTSVKSEDYQSIIIPAGGFRLRPGNPLKPVGGFYSSEQDQVVVNESLFRKYASEQLEASLGGYLSKIEEMTKFNLLFANFEISEKILDIKVASKKDLITKSIILNHGFLNSASFAVAVCLASQYIENITSRVLLLLAGEGLSFNILSLKIRNELIVPLIETDSFFEDGGISHEI